MCWFFLFRVAGLLFSNPWQIFSTNPFTMRPLKIKCPYCEVVFISPRTNQIFCCRAHGYSYRNRMKRHPDPDFQTDCMFFLLTAHVLAKKCRGECVTITTSEFDLLPPLTLEAKKSNLEYAHQVNVPARGTFSEACGYIIQRLEQSVIIYPPEWRYEGLRTKGDLGPL
jgi:hypothetical protein